MKIAEMSWSQVEAYLRDDDRCAVPLGSVEQHANLSLAVDAILSERVAVEAAEPLGVPVFPAVAYGITPYFLAYPGTVSLRVETYVALVRDILDSLRGSWFPAGPDRQRPWRQPAGRLARDRIDGRPSGDADPVPQLVERAQDLRQGAGDRPGRLARLLDGEFPLDAARRASSSRASASR